MFTTRTQLRRIGGRRGVLAGLLLVVVLGAVGIVVLGGQTTDRGSESHRQAAPGGGASPGVATRQDAPVRRVDSAAQVTSNPLRSIVQA